MAQILGIRSFELFITIVIILVFILQIKAQTQSQLNATSVVIVTNTPSTSSNSSGEPSLSIDNLNHNGHNQSGITQQTLHDVSPALPFIINNKEEEEKEVLKKTNETDVILKIQSDK
ncbi:12132_t:CDS:2 [Dentiscutata heterogama]|uniref:12132_t:CDS:1 n=1 Tax=Dentiscutata heterogama TaxID=1316150 RepID=A0ACA9MK85_9GLOM|nr:12132_t:CDS:2 [Dentiscutata heterogama]